MRTPPSEITGKTVNVKTYGRREGILDVVDDDHLDCHLVFTGPTAASGSSAGQTRPWCISNVYLFDAHVLRADQHARGIKGGIASSVRTQLWQSAEIFPAGNENFPLNDAQREMLRLFAPSTA